MIIKSIDVDNTIIKVKLVTIVKIAATILIDLLKPQRIGMDDFPIYLSASISEISKIISRPSIKKNAITETIKISEEPFSEATNAINIEKLLQVAVMILARKPYLLFK